MKDHSNARYIAMEVVREEVLFRPVEIMEN